MDTLIQKSYTPLEAISQSLKEMQLIREGTLPQKDWRTIFDSLEEDENRCEGQ